MAGFSGRHPCLAGAILVGGGSRRMGTDKACLMFNGQTLLERAVTTMVPLVEALYLSGVGPLHPQARNVPDIFPGKGPLGGVFSVLTLAKCERLLVLAVDTPLVRASTLRRLIDMAGEADIAVVQVPQGRVHPLCGVYHRKCLNPMQRLLESGKLRVDGLFEGFGLKVQYVDTNALDCCPEEFLNINTPEDLLRAKELDR